MTAPLLEAVGVCRRFGRDVALAPTDLALVAGDVVALVGPNGAGKSTLLALLGGALPPSGGTVRVAASTRVGWAPQRPAVYARLSPRENLELFARLERRTDAAARADRLLARFDLPAERRPTATLSGGMRQRLNLALALLGEPDVLLLDEPAAALDTARRHVLWAIVEETRGRGGAVAFATHATDDLSRASRVYALDDGTVSYAGAPDEYFARR